MEKKLKILGGNYGFRSSVSIKQLEDELNKNNITFTDLCNYILIKSKNKEKLQNLLQSRELKFYYTKKSEKINEFGKIYVQEEELVKDFLEYEKKVHMEFQSKPLSPPIHTPTPIITRTRTIQPPPPEPIGDETFNQFRYKILAVFTMIFGLLGLLFSETLGSYMLIVGAISIPFIIRKITKTIIVPALCFVFIAIINYFLTGISPILAGAFGGLLFSLFFGYYFSRPLFEYQNDLHENIVKQLWFIALVLLLINIAVVIPFEFDNKNIHETPISPTVTTDPKYGLVFSHNTEAKVLDIAISPDDSYMVVGTGSGGNLYAFNNYGEPIWSKSHICPCTSVDISPDSSFVAVGSSNRGLSLLSRDGRTIWGPSNVRSPADVEFTSNGLYIAVGDYDGNVSLVARNGENMWSYKTSESDNIMSVAASEDGSYIVAGSDDNNVYFFNREGDMLWNFRTRNHVQTVDISNDGSFVVAGNWDRTVFFLSRDGNELWSHTTTNNVKSVSISADNSYVAIASGGIIDFFNQNGEMIWSHKTYGTSWDVEISPESSYVVSGSKSVSLFNLKGEKVWDYNMDPSYVTKVAISSDGSYLATGSHIATSTSTYGYKVNLFKWDSITNNQVAAGTVKVVPKKTAIISSTSPKQSLVLTPSIKRLNVVTDVFNNDVTAAATAGLEETNYGRPFSNGYYYVIDVQGEKYVALNGKVNKLAKLILEQGKILTSDGTLNYVENKTLRSGETWDVGGGWTLELNEIDHKTRLVWVVLSKDGIKKDDFVIAEGGVITYREDFLAGERDVPLFVTYMPTIFLGSNTNIAVFKYTWAISPSVKIIKPGDKLEDLEVVGVDVLNYRLELKSSNGQNSFQTSTSIIPIETPKSQKPTPILGFKGINSYKRSDGTQYVTYKLTIENWNAFPTNFFEIAPDLPPCGLNSEASRTWVRIFDAKDKKYIYGFCAFTSTQDLESFSFLVNAGMKPPDAVYVELIDRKENETYISNTIALS